MCNLSKLNDEGCAFLARIAPGKSGGVNMTKYFGCNPAFAFRKRRVQGNPCRLHIPRKFRGG